MVIKIVLVGGDFYSEQLSLIVECTIIYLIGMLALSFRVYLINVLLSIQKSGLSLVNTVVTIVVNIVLDFILYEKKGCTGLAMATTISLITSVVFLAVILIVRVKIKISRGFFLSLLRVCISAILMIVAMYIFKAVLVFKMENSYVEALLKLLALATVGSGVYFLTVKINRKKIE